MVRLASVLALAVSLAALAGCGASSQAQVNTGTPNCDYSTPPGEMQMTYEAKTEAKASKGDVASSYKPNAQPIPKSGAVHAAVN